MLQSRIFAACILRLDMQNPGISCYMPYVIDSPRSIELEKSPQFHVHPAQYWIIRPDCRMEHSPPWSIRPASCITCMHHITQYHTTQASTGYVYTQRNV